MSNNLPLTSETAPRARMEVRRVPFSYEARSPKQRAGHWNADKPEFSQIVNSGSLAMPYLEPYLIRTMRMARDKITDPALQNELDLYVAQESTHFRQHKKFNDTLRDAGYAAAQTIEERLDADYKKLSDRRSLRFNLAYAEGFESMALAIGEMLIEDREYLFGDSDPATASLILWHFVEEIEHKNVTFDVFKHLHGSYFWRMLGLIYATGHIFWRMGQGYRALLREDGLWSDFSSRWRMLRLLGRIMKNILPKWFRIWRPGYHPSQVPDPKWGLAWAELFDKAPHGAARLDTTRLDAPLPVALSLA